MGFAMGTKDLSGTRRVLSFERTASGGEAPKASADGAKGLLIGFVRDAKGLPGWLQIRRNVCL
jgi:hypothetical protein